MGYAALFSGGKDSSLALWKAQSLGLDIDYLVTVYPKRKDSYMFHKPNLHLVPQLAESLDIELMKIKTAGEKEKELEDLKEGLKNLEINGLITGAVASKYQLERIENVSKELSLDVFAPLWNMDQSELLDELLKNDFQSTLVSVSALGLDDGWLGKTIDEKCIQDLKKLNDRYGINISGEGGEYETLVLGAPNYDQDFKVVEKEKRWDGKRGELVIKKLKKVI
ncbi:MAG: diphthine--ammonia ligase [Candidatus Natronoplasma sp.]